jgi:cell wall-associated NlpC family hydrolase
VEAGIKLPANPAYSGAWLDWGGGTKINRSQIQPGDLVVFDWGDGGRTDHVAIFAGGNRVLGGNQGNKVSYMPYDKSHVVGVVRIDRTSHS